MVDYILRRWYCVRGIVRIWLVDVFGARTIWGVLWLLKEAATFKKFGLWRPRWLYFVWVNLRITWIERI